MPYSKFNLVSVQTTFGLDIHETVHFLPDLPPITPDSLLKDTLAETIPLALAQGNEKARSEWIINPILTAVRRLSNAQVSIFSGREFNIDPEQELVGYVDFLIARSPRLLVLESPIMMMVEAKPENLNAGLGQCAAEMIAAQIFNQRSNQAAGHSSSDYDAPIYGCVTNGELWKFLKLHHKTLTIDLEPYALEPLGRLLGILLHLVCQ
ncbi:MAG: hypothetical protein F6K09_13265 [Merismopedia sp. SIO2A8]|nr:hypothetical protein [Merismopedia sp. SIO2A8]